MKARRDVYQAIADPTRRAIIGLIATGPLDMNSITEKFDVTQQAISLHVKILADCGLVKMKQQGRNRICEAKLGKLSEVDQWISQYRQHYERKLDAMEKYIDKLKKEKEMESVKNDTKDRELIITRIVNAPVELVWEVWTKPEHIAKWWGPDGFSNTITKMEVRPGGVWELIMHGPDGTDYPNKSIFKEVLPLKKIVYEHVSDPHILATITFEKQGKQTFIHWHMLFDNREEFIEVVKKYKADVGLRQNVEKMVTYLERISK